MKEQLSALITELKANAIAFSEVIKFIETYYQHQPTAFKNGEAYNEANQNQGSAKVLAFAQINGLSADDTLYLFAEHYRAVLAHPDGSDHQNMRQFMAHGWPGVVFEGEALVVKGYRALLSAMPIPHSIATGVAIPSRLSNTKKSPCGRTLLLRGARGASFAPWVCHPVIATRSFTMKG